MVARPPRRCSFSSLASCALGAAGLLQLKEECEELLLCRQGVLCLSISAGSTPLGTASCSSSSFVRSFSSLHSVGFLLADLDLVFVKSVLPECFDSSFSRLLSLPLLLLLWVLPTPPFPGGWSYCLVRIYRLSKSLFYFILFGRPPAKKKKKKKKKKSPSDLLNPRSHVISCYGLCRSLLLRHRKKS
jgi:hypothetical protein